MPDPTLTAGAAPDPARPEPRGGGILAGILNDRFCWAIFGGAVLISIIAIIALYPGYDFARHDTAWRRHVNQPDEYGTDDFYNGVVYMQKHFPDQGYYMMHGQSALLRGSYPEAIEAFEQMRKVDPNQPVDAQLGLVYEKMKQPEKAHSYFQAAYNKNPHDPIACYYMGVAAFEAGKYPEAGVLLMRTASDAKYNAMAEPYRKQLMQKTVGQVDMVDTRTLTATLADATTATVHAAAPATTATK